MEKNHTRSPSASPQIRDLATKHTTVKWPIVVYLPSIMLKILKVIRFKTKSSVAQYFKAYLHLKIIFTWLKNGLKLVKLHFCHQIQFSFFIHNVDSVWELKHCPKFSPFLLSLKRSSLSKSSILQ